MYIDLQNKNGLPIKAHRNNSGFGRTYTREILTCPKTRKLTQRSMKGIIYTILFFSHTIVEGQNRIVGTYADYFGNNLELRSDSTFYYSYNFDLSSTWTEGVWSLGNDTLYLKCVPIYDTIVVANSNGVLKDSLILSLNKNPERVLPPDPYILHSYGQNFYPYPKKLFLNRKKLYKISPKGQVLRKKTQGMGDKKKFPSSYRKVKKAV